MSRKLCIVKDDLRFLKSITPNFTDMNTVPASKDYQAFLAEIKEKVYDSQYEAMKQVNKTLIKLYWEIGRSIVEKQQKHNWGKSVVERLSEDLQKEFPGMNGLSNRNVWRMRMFYLQYEKLPPLVAEISWSHNVIIIEKCKDEQERKFYTGMSKKYGWTRNVLIHHIEGRSYEKFLLGQTNFDKALPMKYKQQARLAVKDEYNFEFSIGIIICKEKNRTTVEYALRELHQPIGVTTYKVTPTLPKDYKKYLPSPEAIINSLENMFEDLPEER